LPHPYEQQGIEHVKLWLQHASADTVCGHFLRSQLDQAQLEVGVGKPLFSLDFNIYGDLVTDCWIKMLWKFLWAHNIILETDEPINLPLLREGDEFLVTWFLQQGFTGKRLVQLNHCCLFFCSLTRADVVTGYGLRIHPEVF